MDSCIFCKIVAGEIPSHRVLETADFIAIEDKYPAAKVHVLLIPRKHVESVAHLADDDAELAGRLLLGARDVARQEGVDKTGYRVVINTGPDGNQSVPHLHVHVMGGEPLTGHGTA
ncbi:MAG TPA: histidine triad nucleotide-binding protein [Longimicrobium sp.]|jgi:histidine triad (HIT) family protein